MEPSDADTSNEPIAEERRRVLGEIIRRLRRAKEMTQADLAQRLGTHKQTVVRYEAGAIDIPLSRLTQLEAILGPLASPHAVEDSRDAVDAAERAIIRTPRGFVGRSMRLQRQMAGMTADDAAALFGVRPSTLVNWERGVGTPSGERLFEILSVYRERMGEDAARAAGLRPLIHPRRVQELLDRAGYKGPPEDVVPQPSLAELEDNLARANAAVRSVAPTRYPPGSGLPNAVRTWLQEELLQYTKADVPYERVREAQQLYESPEVFTFFRHGEQRDRTEEDILKGMKGMSVAIRATLAERGFKVGPNREE